MTGAKGLSADHVIVLGADATNLHGTSSEMFFVALTRARTSLHLVFSWGARAATEGEHPRSEMPPVLVDGLRLQLVQTAKPGLRVVSKRNRAAPGATHAASSIFDSSSRIRLSASTLR